MTILSRRWPAPFAWAMLHFPRQFELATCGARAVLVALCFIHSLNRAAEADIDRPPKIDFVHKVVPILKQRCSTCHTGVNRQGGLSMNTRESLLAGGDSGAVIQVGKSADSELLTRISSADPLLRMPPEGPRLTSAEIQILTAWIDANLPWEPGLSLGIDRYDPPLRPRSPRIPVAVLPNRTHPIDCIVDTDRASRDRQPLSIISDEMFLRRVSLDLIGLLPTPAERDAFFADPSPEKRVRLVQRLLARNVDYTEHWLTFWNDLLRNDYAGTGFITGGRKQISRWLYESLLDNKPYDQMARELVAPPTADSAGFSEGIRWRGEVSAGQTVEIQFAQSVGQVFLGINLKCASCHDSFIDRWKLDDAFGLAAIYSQRPLQLHRCDQPTGKMAQPAWIFPEIGQIDPKASQPIRLQQLAQLLTHRENGRFARTIVNRLWHQLMGRGIVHPTDAMQSAPWNSDLLDYLAEQLVQRNYDLKQILELIATSAAYQAPMANETSDLAAASYEFHGPSARRLTAEQFLDNVWHVTGTAPLRIDAPLIRGHQKLISSDNPAGELATESNMSGMTGQWIWSSSIVDAVPAGTTVTFRKTWQLPAAPTRAAGVISADNSYQLFVNGKILSEGSNWEEPDLLSLSALKAGENEILIVARNAGTAPNPAGVYFEVQASFANEGRKTLSTDEHWEWSPQLPGRNGKFNSSSVEWKSANVVDRPERWMKTVQSRLTTVRDRAISADDRMVRASLLKSDFLMRSLGRPNRDQIVSVRPSELTTLEAIDLSNGDSLAELLRNGSVKLSQRPWQNAMQFVDWLYLSTLTRRPTTTERSTLAKTLQFPLSASEVEDVLWVILMLPEFQYVQ